MEFKMNEDIKNPKPITVKELIEHLKQFREDMPVAYQIYSEITLLRLEDITVAKLHPYRPDGWIHRYPNTAVEKVEYVLFPGN
jgi:hypothetical protein